MIKEIIINSWPEFEERIQGELRSIREVLIEMTGTPSIYRGQSDASWHLDTSLERVVGKNMGMVSYFAMIKEIQPEIETFTNNTWIQTENEYIEWLGNPNLRMRDIPDVEYMAYLRHHGYPSPLLDWSYSPYIAAYFAFREITNKAKYVAIFSYQLPMDMLSLSSDPTIFPLYNSPRTNRRHYLQQSMYTLCCAQNDQGIYYASHEDVYSQKRGEFYSGPYVTKYILPASEREAALMSLETYNINAYSLIGTEESLLETLFLREYAIKKARKDKYPDWEGSEW